MHQAQLQADNKECQHPQARGTRATLRRSPRSKHNNSQGAQGRCSITAAAATAEAAGLTPPPVGGLSDLKAARAKQGTLVQHLGRRLTADAVEEVHRALLRWAVAHNVPFNAFSSWHRVGWGHVGAHAAVAPSS
jgi:hypothetical protein